MISLLLEPATSLRPNILQDFMTFYVFPSAESMHFHQVPSISMKFQHVSQSFNELLVAFRNDPKARTSISRQFPSKRLRFGLIHYYFKLQIGSKPGPEMEVSCVGIVQ